MDIKQLSLGPLGTNGYILSKNSQALIFDPGGDSEKIKEYIRSEKLQPTAIFLTHAHFDHIGALEEIRIYYQIDVYVHALENEWLADPSLNGSGLFFAEKMIANEAEHFITTGSVTIGPFAFEVMHTPGHSPGSVSFIFRAEQFIISGDVLFNNGIGRTDLPGGDMKTLGDSIKKKLYTLPENFQVYCGHGNSTTIGNEKQHNPFFSG